MTIKNDKDLEYVIEEIETYLHGEVHKNTETISSSIARKKNKVVQITIKAGGGI